jgi:hypothetical protein
LETVILKRVAAKNCNVVTELHIKSKTFRGRSADDAATLIKQTTMTPQQNDNTKTHLSSDALIKQLDIWIKECEAEIKYFTSRRMPLSETSSLAMKVAYMNVKDFLHEKTLT